MDLKQKVICRQFVDIGIHFVRGEDWDKKVKVFSGGERAVALLNFAFGSIIIVLDGYQITDLRFKEYKEHLILCGEW